MIRSPQSRLGYQRIPYNFLNGNFTTLILFMVKGIYNHRRIMILPKVQQIHHKTERRISNSHLLPNVLITHSFFLVDTKY